MAAAKKTAAMESFKVGDIGLLVATTVVEVGVDVPQADVMVVANPERMGLSQLHQLAAGWDAETNRAPVFFYIRVIYRHRRLRG